jgi:hypothetical protein
MTWNYKLIDRNRVKGILAAIPCTDFARSGARWWKEKDKDGRTEYSIRLVEKTLEIIDYFDPDWWVIENPIGRMHKLVPEVGKPKCYVHPYEFSGYLDNPKREHYSKRTALYGDFNPPIKKQGQVPAIDNTRIHYLGSRGKSEREKTPEGFAYGFFLANSNMGYCPYCHSGKLNRILGRGPMIGLNYYSCRDCNMQFTDTPLTKEELKNHTPFLEEE